MVFFRLALEDIQMVVVMCRLIWACGLFCEGLEGKSFKRNPLFLTNCNP